MRLPGHAHRRQPDDAVIGPLDLTARVDEALAVQAVAFALGATTEGRLVGFVYGMPNDRTHWWSTVVEPYLRAEGRDDWLDDSFVITELHVHPRHQNRGLGRALITTITDAAAEPRSILSAIDTDSPARGLYHSLGYEDLARRVLFPSAPKPYAVMGAPLPLRRR
jgi:ribosomal protein S18 acetylase RimI-like enzyme